MRCCAPIRRRSKSSGAISSSAIAPRPACRDLIERRAVAGIFITAHNVRGKDADTIRRDIEALQAIRKAQGLPPLLVATDQEGGGVSRMSPPLPRPVTLGEIVRSHGD